MGRTQVRRDGRSSGDYVIAGTLNQLRRYDHGHLTDTHDLEQALADMEAADGHRTALHRPRTSYVKADVDRTVGVYPRPVFQGKSDSSVSFDDHCNVYQGF